MDFWFNFYLILAVISFVLASIGAVKMSDPKQFRVLPSAFAIVFCSICWPIFLSILVICEVKAIKKVIKKEVEDGSERQDSGTKNE